jgi:hypothetical protein
MLPSTETIDQALSDLKPLPPHTCPDVDRMLKHLQGEETDADRAAAKTEDPDACSALENASAAINDAARALDNERDIAAALREGSDSRESIAKLAIQGCADRDERIQNLEAEAGELEGLIDLQRNQLGTSQRVINHLGAQIKAAWWTKMANTTKRLWWQARARGMKKRIRRMECAIHVLQDRNLDLYNALLLADGLLFEQEWETGPFGERWCPSCHVTDGGRMIGAPPRHENGCRVGRACEVVRLALRGEARHHGQDPKHVGGERREFQL